MLLLDLSNEILLNILSLVDPVDLVNIYNVCRRLRDLAAWSVNKVILKLHLTGIDCFPNLKSRPFDNLDRIRVNHNWLNGKFSTKDFFTNDESIRSEIVVDEHLYAAVNGRIRKYDRLWNGEYLSSEFKLIGNGNHPEIFKFAMKDDVIFAGCIDRTCMTFKDGRSSIQSTLVSNNLIEDLDLFPKNDIYVTACDESVRIWNRRPNIETLSPVDNIPGGSYCIKCDPLGEKLIIGSEENVILYNFSTTNKEDLLGLDKVWDLMWKDNQTFLSGHGDGSLKLFDLRTKSVCQRIDLGISDIVSIQYDGQNAVLCGFKNAKIINICDLRMIKVLSGFNIFDDEIYRPLIQIVADSKHLFVVTDLVLKICDFSL